jgi:hypothetical protein
LIHSWGLEALSIVQAFASHVGRIIDVCRRRSKNQMGECS